MKEGWEYKKLGDLFPYIKNGANIKQSKDAKGYPITRIETLSGGVFNRDRLGYANIFEIGKYEDYVLKSNDLLLSHINSKAYIGRTVEYRAEEGDTIIHGMNLLRLKSNLDVINSSYFAYYALSTKFKDDIAKIRKDAVNQSSVAISDLKCIKIPLPPLSQQQSIVAELDKINEIIDLKKAQLKDLDLLAQSIFYDMFGDPIENPKGWEVKKLGDVSKVKIGPFGSLLHKSDYVTGGTPLVNPIHMKDGHIVKDDNFTITDEKKNEMTAYLLKEGDVLFARRGEIGRSAIVTKLEDGYLCGTGSLFVRFQERLNNIFVLYWTNSKSFITELVSQAKGATMLNINCKIVEDLNIILPPLSLQQSFAEKIQAIESQKSAIKQSLADVETLLASRMDYYFN